MDGDRTLITEAAEGEAGPIHVSWRLDGHEHGATFKTAFTVGRGDTCDVVIDDPGISREHARMYPADGEWHIVDLDSSNGSFLDKVRVRDVVLPKSSSLTLGKSGPRLQLEVPNAEHGASPKEIASRYFGDHSGDDFGNRTIEVRDFYQKAEKAKKQRYYKIIGAVATLAVLAIGIVGYQAAQLAKTRDLATDIFYNMKSVEVQMAQLEAAIVESGDEKLIGLVAERKEELRSLESQYDQFLSEMDILDDLSEEDRLILRVARMLGESELTMPDEFRDEVKKYIAKWHTSKRLVNSIERLELKNLTMPIASSLLANDLPPQFLYVALQESGFRDASVGPKTRFGIAKGMWQFIPTTARRYGLRTGPLVELPVHDPSDDRYKPKLAAKAAAKYLRDIYNKDAQASGLLVMASYNWGPNNIRRRIREMPENPRERNFWRLLNSHTIPRETHDYVFFIVSAIVIGENPELFGFDFENPLKDIEARLVTDEAS